MKRFFASCGKALLYFLVLLGCQILVPVIYGGILILTDPVLQLDPYAALDHYAQLILDEQLTILLLCNLVTIGIYLLTAPIRRHTLREHFHLHPMTPKAILPLVLLGFSANYTLNIMLTLIPFPQAWWDTYESMSSFIPTELSFVPMLAVSIIGPIAEELCFRGLMYTRLKAGMTGIWAALVISLVFGAVHGTMIWFCYAFPLGLLMVWLFHRFRSLWASIVFHVSFNMVNFFAGYLPEITMWPLSILGCVGTVLCTVWLVRLSHSVES